MKVGTKLEFMLIPYKHGNIRIDIFDMGNWYDVHATSVYGGVVERGENKEECVAKCLRNIGKLMPPQE